MSVETREMKEIEAAVEGILFASGEPVHIDRICLAAELDRPTAELVLQKLMDYYSFERRGMRLLRLEHSVYHFGGHGHRSALGRGGRHLFDGVCGKPAAGEPH